MKRVLSLSLTALLLSGCASTTSAPKTSFDSTVDSVVDDPLLCPVGMWLPDPTGLIVFGICGAGLLWKFVGAPIKNKIQSSDDKDRREKSTVPPKTADGDKTDESDTQKSTR